MTVPERRQQVFVSSTYLDLKVERQAAVQAILNAGHIPAGMELFAAGDQSQHDVIKRWIDDSDIFMLILGGRYGSIEPTSGKSYTQLEYEHALSVGKPYFAVYITDEHLDRKVRADGPSVLETNEPQKYKRFLDTVKSKMCTPFNDPKDIALAVHQSLLSLIRDHKLRGWVKAEAEDERSTLIREIKELRERVNSLQARPEADFNGVTFEQVCESLRELMITVPSLKATYQGNGLDVFKAAFAKANSIYVGLGTEASASAWITLLKRFGLAQSGHNSVSLTENGHRFNNRLQRAS